MVADTVQKVKKYLEYQEGLGLESVPFFVAGTKKAKEPVKPAVLDKNIRKDSSLLAVFEKIGDCKRCRLCEGRKKIVFGDGNANARLMFIGEGPGADEDIQGIPFVGRAGQLLTKIIEAMGHKRKDVYIGNVVKCRPPENRAPLPDEVLACIPFLKEQVNIIKPKVIVCLGSVAMKNLLGADLKISAIRGKFQEYEGIKVMPTYHPAYLLRNPIAKKDVWEDMKRVMEELKNSC